MTVFRVFPDGEHYHATMPVTVARALTRRDLERARAKFGNLHPATWAAYGRAIVAWGRDRLRSIAPKMPPLSLAFRLPDRARLVNACSKALARAEAA